MQMQINVEELGYMLIRVFLRFLPGQQTVPPTGCQEE